MKIFISGGLASAGEHYEQPEMTDGEIRGVVHVIGGLTKKRVALPGYQMRGGSPPPPNGEVIDELSRVFVYLEGESPEANIAALRRALN